MKQLPVWIFVIGAVLIALLANSISAIWAKDENRLSLWLLALIIISPLVFITFGLVTAKLGVAITSGTIDSMLTISTIIVGLVAFQEWNRLSIPQYFGILLAIVGIMLMFFFPKTGT